MTSTVLDDNGRPRTFLTGLGTEIESCRFEVSFVFEHPKQRKVILYRLKSLWFIIKSRYLQSIPSSSISLVSLIFGVWLR